MDWTSLGHAGWLVEAGGLRLLFDPLLGESHHDGVFGVTPPRRIDVDRLRPDVIVVSHRHPDHFDLPSLHALARRSPDAVVLTADVLVGRACQRLGFRHVSVLPDRHDVALDGLSLRTTPSRCSVVEWGMLVSTADGTAWNQVDTVLGSPEQIREELALAATAMGAPSLADGPDLGIVRWQPLLQVTAAIGGSAAFPFAAWQRELERIVATAPRSAVLGAAGGFNHPPGDWQHTWSWPVPFERAARDLAGLAPDRPTYALQPGATWRIRGGEVSCDTDGGRDLVEVVGPSVDRSFRPVTLPPVVDPSARSTDALLAETVPWLKGPLCAALGPTLAQAGVTRAALVLDLVLPEGTAHFTFDVRDGHATLRPGDDPDADLRNVIAASELADVVAGRAHWGRALLGGRLRSVDRLYGVVDGRVVRPRLPPFFLYLALPYDTATERWVDHEVARLMGTPAPASGVRRA
jgi:UDP-MurNAc hydroxylase